METATELQLSSCVWQLILFTKSSVSNIWGALSKAELKQTYGIIFVSGIIVVHFENTGLQYYDSKMNNGMWESEMYR